MLKIFHRVGFLAFAVAAAAMAGGANKGGKEKASTKPKPSTESETGVSTSGSGSAGVAGGSAMLPSTTGSTTGSTSTQSNLTKHSVYFDFDKSNIKSQYQSVIDNWAKYLSANPSVDVQIQGNCDERGSAEYNMALGERRADSVEKALESEGVPSSQMSTISYGKERPVCTQHDEACWWQNRRADIVMQ